jgi:hypothetical protein
MVCTTLLLATVYSYCNGKITWLLVAYHIITVNNEKVFYALNNGTVPKLYFLGASGQFRHDFMTVFCTDD